MSEWYLYVVRCRNGHLYTGIATDVERRLADHRAGRGAKYLRGRGPLTLVFKQRIGEKGLALKIEQQVKRLPKVKKEHLIKNAAAGAELPGVIRP
jgi:putative endonuclease